MVEAHNATAVKPINASFNIDTSNKSATVKAETVGTTLDGDKTLSAIKGCVGSSLHELKLSEQHQVVPTILSGDSRMDNALAAANKMLQAIVTYTMGTITVSTLSASDFGQ